MYKGVGDRYADFISLFLNAHENEIISKLFHFHWIFKKKRGWGTP